jgi:hypothetical protein
VWLANGEKTNKSGDTQTLFFVYALLERLRETDQKEEMQWVSCLVSTPLFQAPTTKEKGYKREQQKRQGGREICDKFQIRS